MKITNLSRRFPVFGSLVVLLTLTHGLFSAVAAAGIEPYSGLLERLPSLPESAEIGTSGANVQAGTASMSDMPAAGKPYWLTAWAETAPVPEWSGTLAPSAIYFRRLSETGDSLENSPRVLLARSQSASRIAVARGQGGAWVVAHSLTDGLRAWWVPSDAAAPVPPPVAVYGATEGLQFQCASDGTYVWVWLATPGASGPDWYAAPQERLAVLELRSGSPALRRIRSDNQLPTHFTGARMFARAGTLFLYSNYELSGGASPGNQNKLSFWTRDAFSSGVQISTGSPWLGVLPWSNGEVLAVISEPLWPLSAVRLIGERFTTAGKVPGSTPQTLMYALSTGALLPLREGGVLPADSGYALITPGFSGHLLHSESALSWKSADGSAQHLIAVAEGEGMVMSEVRREVMPGQQLILTEGSGRVSNLRASLGADSEQVLQSGPVVLPGGIRVPTPTGWSSDAIYPVRALPVVLWESRGASLGGGTPGSNSAAMFQRDAGWGRISLPQEAEATATAVNWPLAPSGGIREFIVCSVQNEDIWQSGWRSDQHLAAGQELGAVHNSIAIGPAVQSEVQVVRAGGASAVYLETSVDSSGDRISKIRQAAIYAGSAAAPVTRYVTTRAISGLREDGSGSFLWKEDSFILTASAGDGTATLTALPAIHQGTPLQAANLLAGNGAILVINQNYQPRVFLRSAAGSDFSASSYLTPAPYPDSTAVAGNSVFWIAHEEGSSAAGLYHQSFAAAGAGPVRRIPTGALVPGEIAAAAGSNGRLLVTVLELDGHLPAPAGYMLAQNPEGLPALQIRQRGPGWADLLWNPTALFPSDRVRLESSTDLRQWQPVSETSMIRTPASGWQLGIPGGFQWTVTHPATDLQVFFRLRADLVP